MTEQSLTQSIFGNNESLSSSESSKENKKKKKKKGEISSSSSSSSKGIDVSNLFDSSSTLPEKPKRLDFTTSSGRKRKKQKKNKQQQTPPTATAEGEKGGDDNNDDAKKKENVKTKKRRKDKAKNDDGKKEETTEGESSDQDGPSSKKNKEKVDEEMTVFVGNLPKDISRKGLAVMFKPCGKVVSARLRSVAAAGVKVAPEYAGNQNLVKKVCANTSQILEDTPKKTAQGYVIFETKDAVQAALKMNNTILPDTEGGEVRLRVDHAKPTIDSTRSVFVGNLKYAADENTLRQHFLNQCGWERSEEDHDAIQAVRIIRDASTQQCKGFGYVLLKDKTFVPQALKIHDSLYMDRNIRVSVCGKRFKGRRGVTKEEEESSELTDKATRVKASVSKQTKNGSIELKTKKKRGVKKQQVPHKKGATLSKRAASGKKEEKRMKKIQKRLAKGMGKTKKN